MLEPMLEDRLKPGSAISRRLIGLCWSCSRIGRCQLGMRESQYEDGILTLWGRCPSSFEGGRRVAHGGWIAAVMDEIGGHLGVSLVERPGWITVTSRLSVEFLRPVPIEQDLVITAWSDAHDQGRWTIHSELRLEAADEVLARGEGVWVERDLSHFDKADRWVESMDLELAPSWREPDVKSV